MPVRLPDLKERVVSLFLFVELVLHTWFELLDCDDMVVVLSLVYFAVSARGDES